MKNINYLQIAIGFAIGWVLALIIGCSTPPWNDQQIEQMKNQDINCVPIFVLETK